VSECFSVSVSVIIPAYNHETYIGEAIESVLKQTHQDFEIIIINDGSTDGTGCEIEKFKDPRITYLSRDNQGAHTTINQGIDLAKGKYISILNSDDVYSSERLEKCFNFLEENTDSYAVMTTIEGIDGDGVPVLSNRTPSIDAWHEWYQDALSVFSDETDMFVNSIGVNLLITTSNFFLRKDVFKSVGKFRELRYAHDWDFLLRLTREHKTSLINDSLLSYRIHQSNTVGESEIKVIFEVNWLMAECLSSLGAEIARDDVRKAMKRNHYLDYEILVFLMALNKIGFTERFLNFENETTKKILSSMT
jgi:glycosyltransferase involved in cell wall biosynthesis